MNQKGLSKIILIFIIFVLIAVAGYFALSNELMKIFNWQELDTQSKQDRPTSTGIPKTPITINLEISKAPKLEEVVTVKLKINLIAFKTKVKAENTEAGIVLPDGAVKVEGDLNWKGDLYPEKPAELIAKIKFIKEGNWEIQGYAKYIIDARNSWGDIDSIYLNVSKRSGSFGYKGMKATEGLETIKIKTETDDVGVQNPVGEKAPRFPE